MMNKELNIAGLEFHLETLSTGKEVEIEFPRDSKKREQELKLVEAIVAKLGEDAYFVQANHGFSFSIGENSYDDTKNDFVKKLQNVVQTLATQAEQEIHDSDPLNVSRFLNTVIQKNSALESQDIAAKHEASSANQATATLVDNFASTLRNIARSRGISMKTESIAQALAEAANAHAGTAESLKPVFKAVLVKAGEKEKAAQYFAEDLLLHAKSLLPDAKQSFAR